ncbi:SGNH/GDSL hydrolase family protein [Phenylobacterium sp.]|uniref:SGNH/GDSL hydrolase family protein n=1 Tax=Phenylobacterium sp. TaxID=1871053 RepID=UPI002DE6A481|nr:SGNH/GDSL hydrolase family protein [Phenylobacterium sp.]
MPTSPTPPAFTGVYVFGDSLVDGGNDLKAAQALGQIPLVDLPVDAPTAANGYFDGRFSDGWNFADLISNKLTHESTQATFPFGMTNAVAGFSLPLVGQPFGDNLNFAYGGALAVGSDVLPPPLHTQIVIYEGAYRADPNALYILSMGDNDLRALVPTSGAMVTGAAADQALAAVAAEIAADVASLLAHGVRHIVVAEVPDIGTTPEYLGAPDEAARRALATQYAHTVDDLLRTKLSALTLPIGASVLDYSFLDYTGLAVTNPAAHGFADVTHAQRETQAGPLDGSTGGFLFFDEVHPTAQAHAQIAASILDALSGSAPVETVPVAIGAQAAASVAAGATDSFTVTLSAGHTYVIDVLGTGSGAGTLADPLLRVAAPGGAVVAQDDDSGLGLDPHLSFTPSVSGDFTLMVSGVGASAGGFHLQVGEAGGANLLTDGQLRGSNETVTGGAGDDTLAAAGGSNQLRGAAGNDFIQGGSGFDDINGNKGDDTIDGGSGGADWLVGGQGNDLITAHAGQNILYGNIGNDTLHGGSGGDLLRGGQGDDVIVGGSGNDWISGDRGNDTLTGGAGADIFHTFNGAGLDVVTDFHSAEGDRVQVDPGTSYTLSQSGADVIIDLGGGDEMILRNVQLSSLPPGWIFGA